MNIAYTLNGSGFQDFAEVIVVSYMHNSEKKTIFYLSFRKWNKSSRAAVRVWFARPSGL